MPKKLTSKQYADVATGVRLSSHEKLCAERMKALQEAIKELPEWDIPDFEKQKIVIKFECKEVGKQI